MKKSDMFSLIMLASLVTQIADQIAACDFRVTMSRYVTRPGSPWIITVGETGWQRHLVVEEVNPLGTDANLAVLTRGQSSNFGYKINDKSIERYVTLKQLTVNKHQSVLAVLCPPARAT